GLRGSAPAVRRRRARAAHRRADDDDSSRQASPGVRRQAQRGAGWNRARRSTDRRGHRRPRLDPGGQAHRRSQPRRRPPEPLAVLAFDEPRRRRHARWRTGRSDRRGVRLLRRLQGHVRGRRCRPVRLGLGLARPRRRQARRHEHAQSGQPDQLGPDPAARQRRLGARVLPEVPEQAPRLPEGLVEHRRLDGNRRALQRRNRL
ncbi:MAG: Superoxide dismutase [Mn], partial [uncultured Solirubrobacteraceae bacterium]